MSDRERIQLNLRLDGYKELYEAVKAEATKQNTSVNSFVINALKAALGWEADNHIQASSIDLEAKIEAILDKKLGDRLGKSAA
ncbi:hypothetical protein NIES4106_03050 [Fischerella sp. NIES-4106]|jgi:uncharacterized protein (DUF1778 family)|nr:hypothetical protein NIES4106_03050 [Fischerella sp. NIES-4106]